MTRSDVVKSAMKWATLMALLLLGGPTTAQAPEAGQVTGTIEGTIGGEAAIWETLYQPGPYGPQNSASVHAIVGESGPHIYTVHGFSGESPLARSLSISFESLLGPLADCPCSVEGTAQFWLGNSLSTDYYLSEEVTIEIDAIESLGEGGYRVRGGVEATMLFHTGLGEVDEEDGLELDVVFDIERLSPKVM